MLKLLVMLIAFLGIGLALIGLRQRRWELTSQCAQIYTQIQERNETLLDQRVVIARKTNPWALATALKDSGVDTGSALQPRATSLKAATLPAVETDLVDPVR